LLQPVAVPLWLHPRFAAAFPAAACQPSAGQSSAVEKLPPSRRDRETHLKDETNLRETIRFSTFVN
jgi:hypothetical protein